MTEPEGPTSEESNKNTTTHDNNPNSQHTNVFTPVTSRMTDSDLRGGDEIPATGTAQSSVGVQESNDRTQVSGKSGEHGSPPSRPDSTVTGISSKRGTWSQPPPPSRRGLGTSGAPGASIAGSVGASSTRPSTAASRTHVPSITSHAFFRPMSSQRLQAQRGQRPNSTFGRASPAFSSTDGGSNPNRESTGSNPTIRGGPLLGLHHDYDARPPPSRGTDITADMPDRTTANTTPTGAETVRSRGESVTPLQRPTPQHLDLSMAYKGNSGALPTPQKSPRSFRSSFILPSRGGNPGTSRPQGHEKLSSAASSPRLATGAASTKEEVKNELGKNYEYFSGNTVFCWGGRLQNTRDRPIVVATGLLIVVPAALFFAFSAPWLWRHVSPAIPILFAYLFLICMSSFFHASLSDPGIHPRNLHPFPPSNPNDDPLAIGPPLTEWTLVISATSKSAAMEVPTKYCKTCNNWRPPRAHHCRVCDSCIETQDHHCVWLNNCIGRRNYRYFFAFITSGTILGLLLLGASLAHLLVWMNRENTTFSEAVDKWRVPFAMFIYSILLSWYPASLTGYHLYLVSRAETTREYLNSQKLSKKDRHRPFMQANILKNLIVVLLRPRSPTFLRFKHKYEEGDQRFGPRRGKRAAPLQPEHQNGGVEMQDVSAVGATPSFQGPRRGQGTVINSTPRVDVQQG
ncbi:hypothetical protein M501DRAFT_1003573 [Patellaria atrata CBS 101060]|uniref:Palmitoyltransferase n=1 Tax=Patellaria atrata CBS 101060 TaxID=1346257 RepID=A0A9P4SAT7_9PEZI|nr:hypothetical protein M501DRAFT_1003573 [Patellaria atrata CBS 101060]